MLEIMRNEEQKYNYCFDIKKYLFYKVYDDGRKELCRTYSGSRVSLTPTEKEILETLIENTVNGKEKTPLAELVALTNSDDPRSGAPKGHIAHINAKFKDDSCWDKQKNKNSKSSKTNEDPSSPDEKFRFDSGEYAGNGLVIRQKDYEYYLNSAFFREIEDEWKRIHNYDSEIEKYETIDNSNESVPLKQTVPLDVSKVWKNIGPVYKPEPANIFYTLEDEDVEASSPEGNNEQ